VPAVLSAAGRRQYQREVMQPVTVDEIQRAIDEASRSGNFFLLYAIKRMAWELRELRDRHAASCFLQHLEPDI
jgi:hypothetical protein